MRALVFLSLLLSLQTYATQTDHDAAHFGVAFAGNTFVYGFMETLGGTQSDSMIFAGGTTMFMGTVYKMMQFPTVPALTRSLAFDALGASVSDLVMYMFHLKNKETTPEAFITGTEAGVRIPLGK